MSAVAMALLVAWLLVDIAHSADGRRTGPHDRTRDSKRPFKAMC
jgi:hypothetical protein